MGETTYTTTAIVAEKCWVCGVPFGLDVAYRKERMADGATFHCPNGHRIRYGQTETEILRKQLERERQATLNAVAATQRQRERTEQAQRRAAAARGVVTRIKRRVGKGICPCCIPIGAPMPNPTPAEQSAVERLRRLATYLRADTSPVVRDAVLELAGRVEALERRQKDAESSLDAMYGALESERGGERTGADERDGWTKMQPVREALAAGRFVDAVRHYRNNFNVTLKEAKRVVEALRPAQPSVSEPEGAEQKQAQGPRACPFCGSSRTPRLHNSAEDYDGLPTSDWNVVCDALKGGCGASGGYERSKEKALANWNRTPPESSVPDRREAPEPEPSKKIEELPAASRSEDAEKRALIDLARQAWGDANTMLSDEFVAKWAGWIFSVAHPPAALRSVSEPQAEAQQPVAPDEEDARIGAWHDVWGLCLTLGMDTDSEETGKECVLAFIRSLYAGAPAAPQPFEKIEESSLSPRGAAGTGEVCGARRAKPTSEEKIAQACRHLGGLPCPDCGMGLAEALLNEGGDV